MSITLVIVFEDVSKSPLTLTYELLPEPMGVTPESLP